MEIRYRPPLNMPEECDFLERNMVACLKEKSVKDELPTRKCNVEQILWFFLECPGKSDLYENQDQLRDIYGKVQLNQHFQLPVPAAAAKKK